MLGMSILVESLVLMVVNTISWVIDKSIEIVKMITNKKKGVV